MTGGGAAGSEAGYAIDSGTADLVDSAPADVDEMSVMAAGGGGWGRTAAAGCPRAVALFDDAGVVAPTRIDAGGGGAAAAGSAAGPALGAVTAGLAAAVGVRRRRRP